MKRRPTLSDYLAERRSAGEVSQAVSVTLSALALGAIALEETLSSPEGAEKAYTVGENADGDPQKALDVHAHDIFLKVLEKGAVGVVASEESVLPILLDADEATLALAIDPLDGSSNIETNAPVGTIFALFPFDKKTPESSFANAQNTIFAAGFVTYGTRTHLYLTVGQGTHLFILDRRLGSFVLFAESIQIPNDTQEFAINMSNVRHWHPPVQRYIDTCLEGQQGKRGKDFNMRWIASLVADASRIFTRGGVFLYPEDKRPGYEKGRLRLLYEGLPIALLVEQAGGGASNGLCRILDILPEEIHHRTPLIFGSKNEVAVLDELYRGHY